MHVKSLDFFFNYFASEQMNFLYTGDFSDEHTDSFIQLNNHQYNASDEYKKLQRKASFLIAECFQNIVRHHEPSHKNSYFNIKNNQGILSIVSGNTVNNKIIPSLKGQLEQLNNLTSSELKEHYREILSNGEYSDKGGAGLGLIEIARRSKNKLSFDFEPIDEEKSYFYFGLHLHLIEPESHLEAFNFDDSISLRNQMLHEKLFFIYNGVISIQTSIIILGIIEKTLDSVLQKVVFVKFMGFLEKLCQDNNPEIEDNKGMLMIGEDEKEYNIAAACYIDKNEARRYERIAKFYTMLDGEALDKEYKQIIKDNKTDSSNSAKIDLIEILKSSSAFELKVQSYSDNISLLQLVLKFQKKKKSKIVDLGQKAQEAKHILANQETVKKEI